MSIRLKNYSDFWAAMMFAVISLIFLWNSANLTLGTLGRMGPAFMPRLLCGLMLVVALVLFIRSFRIDGGEKISLGLRPMLVVPGAMVVFALALHPLGLVTAICLAVVTASLAAGGSKPLEVALAAIFLSILCVSAFVYGLRLNLSIWPGA